MRPFESTLRAGMRRGLRYWAYFRRGHGIYLALLISFLNFLVIQYRLLIQQAPALSGLFHGLAEFAAAFTLIYAVAATLIGWIDYKRGSVAVDNVLIAQASPFTLDTVEAGILSNQAFLAFLAGDVEEAKRMSKQAAAILRRWSRRGGSGEPGR